MNGSQYEVLRLIPVLDAAYQSKQLVMAKITKRIEELNEQLKKLERPEETDTSEISPATMAGADLNWHAWAQDRKKLINHELALAFRDKEIARVELGKALAKLEATKGILKSLQVKQRQLTLRRTNY